MRRPDTSGSDADADPVAAGRHAASGHDTLLRFGARCGVALLTAAAFARALREPLGSPEPTRQNLLVVTGQDFRDATYFPVKELLHGGDPYDPRVMLAGWPVRQEFDLYAPAHLVLHLPFALLPYRVALTLYLFVLLAALMALAAVSARAVRLPGGRLAATFVGACVVGSQLGKSAVFLGQLNPLVALGGVLAVTRFHDAPRLAAAGLALAWIKPQYGIPLTVLLLARGAWRPALRGTALVTALSLPVAVLLVVREGGLGGFVEVIRRNLDVARSTPYAALDNPDLGRVDVGAVLFRLTGRHPPVVELLAVVAVLGLSCWLVGGRARRGLPFDVPELGVVTVAVLVSLVHQQGESLLTLPVVLGVVAWWRAWATGEPGTDDRPPLPMIVAAVLLCVPAAHVSAAASAIRATLGTRADTLVDALSLLIAFGAAAVVAARRRGRDELAPW